MALPHLYDAGTASVANGATTITFHDVFMGTEDLPNFRPGDLFAVLAQPLVPPQRLASVNISAGTAELASAWPGTGLDHAAYEVRYIGDVRRSTAQTRKVIEELSVVAANGRGLFMRFDDGTADADPGDGKIRFNALDITTATAAYIDNLDANDATISAIIDSWDDLGGSSDRGQLWARSIADPSVFHALKMTGSVVTGTGYRKLTLEYIGGSGAFTAAEDLMIQPPAKGNQGAAFTWSGEAADPAGLTAFEGEADGYRVFVLDLGATEFGSYAGRSGVAEWNGIDTWTLIAVYTGPKGDQGDKGWAPQLVTEVDGERTVLKLAGYVGGDGTAPTANVGEYLKPDGTFTATIGDARDVTGAKGVNWQGDYSGATAYVLDDGVLYNGSSWRALGATTGNAPPTLPTTSNAYWTLIARAGTDGAGTVASVAAGTSISVDVTDPTAPVVSAPTVVVGPASAVADRVAVFDTTSGKLLKDGGKTIAELVPAGYEDLLISVSLLALQVADNTNVALFLGRGGNGFPDSFDALTYVDVAGATNLDTSAAGLLKPTTSANPISLAGGTVLTNADSNTSAAFDGTTSQIATAAQTKSNVASNSMQVGKTLAAPSSVKSALVFGSSDKGYVAGASASLTSLTITLYGKQGAAPSNGTNGTSLGAITFTNTANESVGRVITSSDAVTVWDHVWVNITQAQNLNLHIAELQLSAPDTANNMTVRSASLTAASAPTKMKGLLRVKEIDAAVAGTDYTLECSRDGGTTWSTMTLTELFTSPSPTAGIRVVEAAETDVSGQPSGTSPRWRFKTLNNKNVELHDVYFYWS